MEASVRRDGAIRDGGGGDVAVIDEAVRPGSGAPVMEEAVLA